MRIFIESTRQTQNASNELVMGPQCELTMYRATDQNQDMIRLLRDLRQRIGGPDKKKIEDMLAVYSDRHSTATPLIVGRF